MYAEAFQSDPYINCVDDGVPMSAEDVGLVLAILARWSLRATERPGRPREVRAAGK